jgi:hypothetical protein
VKRYSYVGNRFMWYTDVLTEKWIPVPLRQAGGLRNSGITGNICLVKFAPSIDRVYLRIKVPLSSDKDFVTPLRWPRVVSGTPRRWYRSGV